MSHLDRITQSSERGPCLRDTGMTVASVLTLLGAGESVESILVLHPALEGDDVRAALDFVMSVVSGPGGTTRGAAILRIPRRSLMELLEQYRIPRPQPAKEPSPTARRHIEALFSPSERSAAERLLAGLFPVSSPPTDWERVHFGALRVSHGDLAKLTEVVGQDWRDTLMAAGFGHDVHAHEAWVPRPLTVDVASSWEKGGLIDGVLFQSGEPANLHRRGRIEGEPCAVVSLVALEPEPTYTVRTGKPGAEEILTVFQSWLEPLANRALNPTGRRPAG